MSGGEFSAPYLYACNVRTFVAADIISAWVKRGIRDSFAMWRIAEDRRDYRLAAMPVTR